MNTFGHETKLRIRIVVRRVIKVETLSSERPSCIQERIKTRRCCAREPGNPHSPDAIVVKLGDSSSHVPDQLARILAPMLDGGVITCMEGTVTGVTRSASEGVWVPGGGIEIPCEYVLCTV